MYYPLYYQKKNQCHYQQKYLAHFMRHICVPIGNTMFISFIILHTSSECIFIIGYILMSHSIFNPTFFRKKKKSILRVTFMRNTSFLANSVYETCTNAQMCEHLWEIYRFKHNAIWARDRNGHPEQIQLKYTHT